MGCPAVGEPARPLVLLDASLSMAAAGGRWTEARALAAQLGEVRAFGDGAPDAPDSLPVRGGSRVGPALAAALATGRPVTIVTDGELDDVRDLDPGQLARAAVRVLPRAPVADLAVTAVRGPARVAQADTLRLEVELRREGPGPDEVPVTIAWARGSLLTRAVRLREGVARERLAVPARTLPSGDHVLRVSVPPGDAEARTDERLHVVRVVPTPGVVLVASPGDWDARFLYRALRDVTELPAQGFVRLAPGRWFDMASLRPVDDAAVRRAVAGADLLVARGDVGDVTQGSRPAALWRWPTAAGGAPGDWYAQPPTPSPLAGAFAGAPVESLPPLTALRPLEAPPGGWVALAVQEGRRGAERAAVVGVDEGRTRRLEVGADGLWRWAFRGGSAEQAYRAFVGSGVAWLLGSAERRAGAVRPVREVVQAGRPLVVQATGADTARAVVVDWSGAMSRTDTLRLDADGRARVWLPPGEWRWRLADGAGGLVAVERYSDELLPRAVTLADQPGRDEADRRPRAARDLPWLFALAIAGFSGEWFARRRLGLR